MPLPLPPPIPLPLPLPLLLLLLRYCYYYYYFFCCYCYHCYHYHYDGTTSASRGQVHEDIIDQPRLDRVNLPSISGESLAARVRRGRQSVTYRV